LATLLSDSRRSGNKPQSACHGDAQDTGASDKNWQQLLRLTDLWRYL
jgi:hypothetical protein